MPVTRLENGSWPHPARLPLGCGWTGHCTAPGHEHAVPSQDVLETFCNLGYASRCGWAPEQRPRDAVRFAIVARPNDARGKKKAQDASARILRLRYVYERDNRPAGQGELEFDFSAATWVRRHEDLRIQKMAECFLETYLSNKP
jgi:hypothetical protein